MPPSAIPLTHAYRLLNHGPTVLVSSAHGGRRNVMAAAWNMPLDFDPPKVAVVIDKSTYTRELIEASGEFVLAVPSRAIAAQVLEVGSRSGRDGDKFEALGLEAMPAARVAAPLPAGCIGWLGLDKDSVNLDMGITIRSMWLRDNRLFWQAGGGIVHDSDPDMEWKEVCNKSAIMRLALRAEDEENVLAHR